MMIGMTNAMDQPQSPSQTIPSSTVETPQQTPKKEQSYWHRLFAGRMNRQNYIIGSTVAAIFPTICFFVVIFNILLSPTTFDMPSLDPTNSDKIIMPQVSITSLVMTPANELWIALGLISVLITVPYLFSMQIRRQHDLNMNGWWWIVNIVPAVELYTYAPHSAAAPGTNLWYVASFLSTASSLFSLYFTIWPGTKGVNKYGEPPTARTSIRKDVLALD